MIFKNSLHFLMILLKSILMFHIRLATVIYISILCELCGSCTLLGPPWLYQLPVLKYLSKNKTKPKKRKLKLYLFIITYNCLYIPHQKKTQYILQIHSCNIWRPCIFKSYRNIMVQESDLSKQCIFYKF